MSGKEEQLWLILSQIPAGRVATYGQIAAMIGTGPRQVAQMLRQLPNDSSLPWHRVVSSGPKIAEFPGAMRQKTLLQQEGLDIGCSNRIASEHLWLP